MKEKTGEFGSLFSSVVLTSEEIPFNEVVKKEIRLGEKLIRLEALSRKGLPYFGTRTNSEDGCVVIKNNDALQAFVVDAGTQERKIPTLEELGMTGGRYLTTMMEYFGKGLDPRNRVVVNLKTLNTLFGCHARFHHPSISYKENSRNSPYGSIAAIKIDTRNNILEVANAGDVFVLAVNDREVPALLTVDDVRKKDEETFAVTRRIANKYRVSFRKAMQQRAKDSRFFEIVEEMRKTKYLGNIGKIRRITGAPNFEVTSSIKIPLNNIKSLFIFTDGGILPGNNIYTIEGQNDYLKFIELNGIQRLNEEIQKRLINDPDYEKYPRFGTVDDLFFLALSLN